MEPRLLTPRLALNPQLYCSLLDSVSKQRLQAVHASRASQLPGRQFPHGWKVWDRPWEHLLWCHSLVTRPAFPGDSKILRSLGQVA